MRQLGGGELPGRDLGDQQQAVAVGIVQDSVRLGVMDRAGEDRVQTLQIGEIRRQDGERFGQAVGRGVRVARQPDQTHGLPVEIEPGLAQFDGPDPEGLIRGVEKRTVAGAQGGFPAVQVRLIEVPEHRVCELRGQGDLPACPRGEVDGRGGGGGQHGRAAGLMAHVAHHHPRQRLRRGVRHRHGGGEGRRVGPADADQLGDGHQALLGDEGTAGEVQGDLAHDAAVMPPVERPVGWEGRRQAVGGASVVHPHGQDVRRAGAGQAADVELEGGVASFVRPEVNPVPPDLGQVEDGAEAEADMGLPGRRRQRELPAVPGDAGVVGMRGHDVPGARHCDGLPGGVIERRLGPAPPQPVRLGVDREPPGAGQRQRLRGHRDERAGLAPPGRRR
jgi:hypothetical protein